MKLHYSWWWIFLNIIFCSNFKRRFRINATNHLKILCAQREWEKIKKFHWSSCWIHFSKTQIFRINNSLSLFHSYFIIIIVIFISLFYEVNYFFKVSYLHSVYFSSWLSIRRRTLVIPLYKICIYFSHLLKPWLENKYTQFNLIFK